MKKLRVCGANDTFGALNLILDVLEGNCAGFISAPEVNGVLPEVFLPEEVADDVGLIVESSGSTGSPKQIELSVAALRHSATASLARLGGPGQWLLALTPQFIAGVNVLTRSVLSDSQPVIMNTQVPFTTEAFVRGASLMEGERRYTSLVPAQLQRIAAEVDSDAFLFSTLRKFDAILVGGQAADFAQVESLRAKGINIILSYGMAETCGGCVYDGVALDGVAIKIVDGLIEISGPVVANGLGGSYLSNDLGEMVDGKLKVLGRADRVIVSGGLKVSLERVEEAALAIAGVEEVAACAVESEWGQSVGIVYSGSPEVSFEQLTEAISPAAKARKVLRVEALPRLSSGKPDLVACSKLLAD